MSPARASRIRLQSMERVAGIGRTLEQGTAQQQDQSANHRPKCKRFTSKATAVVDVPLHGEFRKLVIELDSGLGVGNWFASAEAWPL